MSRLGLGLGITKGGVIPFNPLSLDPYLLFDTQSSMIGTFENPTLDLDPSVPSTLDVITATRAGVATYTDADGLIQSATPNTVRVDQTQGAELTPTKFQRFINTEFNQAYWSFSSQMGNPVYNYDTAPNGEQEATRIVSNGGSYPQIVETIEGLTIGQQYTASFYVKSDGTSQIQQATHFTGLSGGIGFTPTDNWERASYTITATATTHSFVIFTNGSSTPASSYLIWGPQLEEGTTASSFVANTTGSPKFIASATFGPRVPMILVEPSSENLVTYSEVFNDVNGSIRTTGIDAPDGSNNAQRFSGALAIDGVFANSTTASIPTGSAVDYVGSIYVRGTAGETINVFMKRAGAGPLTTTGSLTVLLTGDWQRVENLSLTTDPANNTLRIFLSSSSETADSVDLWGGQIELGSVSTSYIPTSGSTSTRAADDLVISGSDFTDFYNQSEGTFYVETNLRTDENLPHIFEAYNSAATNKRITLYVNSPFNSFGFYMQNIGTQANETIGLVNVGQLNRAAYSFKTNDLLGSVNGGTEVSDTSASIPVDLNTLAIGNLYNGLYPLNGHIKRLIYWPYHSDIL